MADELTDAELQELAEIGRTLKKEGDPDGDKVISFIRSTLSARASENRTPRGIFSGGGAIEAGESLPHAAIRQGLAGVGRLAEGALMLPTEPIAQGLRAPETEFEQGLARGGGSFALAGKRMLIDPAEQQAAVARQNFAEGHPVYGTIQAALSAIPLAGPMAGGILERARQGDVGAISEAAGMALLPEAFRKGEAATGAIDAALTRRAKARGTQQMLEVAKAPGRNLQFRQDLEASIPELQKIHKELPLEAQGNIKVRELTEKISDRLDQMWEENHNEPITRHANEPLGTQNLVNAGMEEITPGASRANPAAAKTARNWLEKQVSPEMTIEQADQLRQALSRETKSAYGKSAPLLLDVKKAVLDKLRERIDQRLFDLGEEHIKEANFRYGALNNVNKVLESRINAAERAPTRSGMAREAVIGFAGAGIRGRWAGAAINLGRMLSALKGGPGDVVQSALENLSRE